MSTGFQHASNTDAEAEEALAEVRGTIVVMVAGEAAKRSIWG